MWVVVKIKVPFLGSLNNMCRTIGTQKGTIILTTTHVSKERCRTGLRLACQLRFSTFGFGACGIWSRGLSPLEWEILQARTYLQLPIEALESRKIVQIASLGLKRLTETFHGPKFSGLPNQACSCNSGFEAPSVALVSQ